MAAGRYKSVDVVNPRGRYQEPSVVIVKISNHRDGHYVRPNRVALEYPDLKKKLTQTFMSECSIL
jgi:hypothetical protein